MYLQDNMGISFETLIRTIILNSFVRLSNYSLSSLLYKSLMEAETVPVSICISLLHKLINSILSDIYKNTVKVSENKINFSYRAIIPEKVAP